ncbi:MAG: diguanylate cyclase [Butyrivibrio sp.]|nr:diguanylate cyclase [Butyrivibrio sp.]
MGKKILIVDDDEMIRMMTNKILSKTYTIVSADSGQQAIELYETEKPDMIISDLVMPGMSGFEMMDILREKYAFVIPVIFMTAYSSDDTEKKGLETGAVDYIRKPFKADILLQRVDNVFNNLEKIRGLQQAAELEPMTGLLNKTTTAKEITNIASKGIGIFMMIDLDSFKLINDIHGHEMGDKVLIWFADTLRSIMRSSDIIGRVGGDEFAAFCQNTKDEIIVKERTEFLNRKITEFCKSIMGDDMNIPIGVSIGAVVCPDEGTDYVTLYKKADQALYTVKRAGKHNYAFYKTAEPGEEPGKCNDMDEIRMILGERESKRGGYVLDDNQFKLIYRFLVRFQRNYAWDIKFLAFTITAKDGSSNVAEGAGRFIEVASSCLRGSDCLTRYGNNRVLAILLKTTDDNYQIPIDRIIEKWEELPYSEKFTFTFEEESLIPD